jgi:hypothetical protein
MYIGEFSSGLKFKSTLTTDQLTAFVKNMKRFGACGFAIWRWSYIPDQNIPAFNMTKIINNRVQPGDHFLSFVNALKQNYL